MKITALAGGIGAAKFLVGLSRRMPPEEITIIANTGDDIELFGLRICPDIDTLVYTLAGVINEATGWGVAGDTFESLKWMSRYGEAAWFNLGDRDLATHIHRTDLLRRGHTLSEATDRIRRSLGVASRVLPATDSYAPTRVVTPEGEMHFQEYFVRRRAEPVVREIKFDNVDRAEPSDGVIESILGAEAVIVCPSNPFISIGPILAIKGVRAALKEARAQVAAITPIIGGRALKGPAAAMLGDLGHEVSARGVAALYQDFADIFVLDKQDAELAASIEGLGLRVVVTDTVMSSVEDKEQLAREILKAVSDEE
ncbi:MAG TPA: 2-phospho-L-lactate transferase [Blastocatellia bacterium]|nr:2-phospho-L-lactate transferase [Blastocatellia bacterium]